MKMLPATAESSALARQLVHVISHAPTIVEMDLTALATVVGMLCANADVDVPEDFMRAALEAREFALRMRACPRVGVASA